MKTRRRSALPDLRKARKIVESHLGKPLSSVTGRKERNKTALLVIEEFERQKRRDRERGA